MLCLSRGKHSYAPEESMYFIICLLLRIEILDPITAVGLIMKKIFGADVNIWGQQSFFRLLKSLFFGILSPETELVIVFIQFYGNP